MYAAFGDARRQSSSYNPRPTTYKAKGGAGRAKWLPSSDVGGPAAPTPRVEVAADISSRFVDQGLTVYRIAMDGNCLFRSFGFQLPGWGQGKYKELRKTAVDHMVKHSDLFAPFCEAEVDASFDDYISQMSANKCWGGEPELSALAHHFRVTVVVYDAYTSSSLQVYNEGHQPVILLCKSNGHYNAVIDNAILSPTSQVFTPGHRNLQAIMNAQFPESQPTPGHGSGPGRPAFPDEASAVPDVPSTVPSLPAEDVPDVDDLFEPVEDPEDLAEDEPLEEKMALRMAEWMATLRALEDQEILEERISGGGGGGGGKAKKDNKKKNNKKKAGGKKALKIAIPGRR